MDPQLVKDLISTRRALRQKFKSLKSDIQKSQSTLEKSYRPITEPLKQLITSLQPDYTIKAEPKEETPITPKRFYKTVPDISLEETYEYDPTKQRPRDASIFIPEYGESFFDETIPQQQPTLTKEEEEELQFQQYLEQYGKPLPRAYIEDMIRTAGKDFDERFGIYFNPEKEKFAIGNLTLEFDGSDILLGDEKFRYKGTPGFYELLF